MTVTTVKAKTFDINKDRKHISKRQLYILFITTIGSIALKFDADVLNI